ncbi:type II toxin-antitoxin system YafO family toxin [Serratia bockelmannii]|uniref:type II toxin-antitoxin system YafO family toxin n=1 Tax=Serratia bockelmannii TaxID=2703793 RepID=UPI003FA72BE4
MASVTIYSGIEHPHIAQAYASLLQNWKNGAPRPLMFGNEGQWESNSRLRDSLVYKIHIRLPDEEPWPPSTPVLNRKSDNYLVYCVCWHDETKYQLISIMSPGAHSMANTSFMAELERRAEGFQNI